MLVGLHADENSQREVPKPKARKWASDRFLQFFEVSAKTNANVDNVLNAMAVLIRRAKDGYPLRTRLRSLSASMSESAATPHSSTKSTNPKDGDGTEPEESDESPKSS